MNRFSAFAAMMDTLFEFSSVSSVNQNLPRTYGTDDVMYMAEVHLLRDIRNTNDASVTKIAEAQGKSKSAITQIVNKLEKKHLIEKVRIPGSRNTLLTLTDRGYIVTEFHDRFDKEQYSHILSHLPDYSNEDFQKITGLIRIIIDGSKQAITEKRECADAFAPSREDAILPSHHSL